MVEYFKGMCNESGLNEKGCVLITHKLVISGCYPFSTVLYACCVRMSDSINVFVVITTTGC